MTTAASRLVSLSGLSGVSAGQHLVSISLAGVTSGARLVSRSGLPTGTAAAHLLAGGGPSPSLLGGPGFIVNVGRMMGR